MRFIFLFTFLIGFISCDPNPKNEKKELAINTSKSSKILSDSLKNIFKDQQLLGSILIYDPLQGSYFSNDFEWSESSKISASTFKIPNSMIALEAGVIDNEETMIYWDKTIRPVDKWNQDMTFKEAFQKSCLPCYQQIARKVGVEKMKSFIDKLDYPKHIVDASNLDIFWLIKPGQITQFQQIEFLERLHHSEIDISERTESIVKNILVIDSLSNQDFIFRGKTGWTYNDDYNNGWFVGYLIKNNNPIYFALNIEPKPSFDMKQFSKIRINLTLEALKKLNYY